jgi:predicted dehydrogenase
MPTRLDRRRFLLSATVATLGLRSVSARRDTDKLRVGAIGIAGQGFSDLRAIAAAGAEIVALCDVDTKRDQVVEQIKHFSKAKFYTDFRKMIDAGGLDAVMVATPDHTHAHPTLTALKANLHVFCEKPLTHSVEEARAVATLAAKQKRVTQMGTQIHAVENYRRVVELVQAEAIGPVREVHVWCDKSWGGDGKRPTAKEEIPAGLDWDLWCGPTLERPYSKQYVPFNWRRYWAFGGGTLNDMACHFMDLPFWALDLRYPTKVEAIGPKASDETAPNSLTVKYEFPARGKMPACKFTWYDGGLKPKMPDGTQPEWGSGVLFIGDKGMLLADYGRRKLLPEKDFKDFTAPKPTIAKSIGHYKEWVEACKNGSKTTCNFDYSGALTEAVLLGTVSHRLGTGFDWDGEKFKASDPGAEKFLRKEYRKGWQLPG